MPSPQNQCEKTSMVSALPRGLFRSRLKIYRRAGMGFEAAFEPYKWLEDRVRRVNIYVTYRGYVVAGTSDLTVS